MIQPKNNFEIRDISRLRNPKNKRFTLPENHRTSFIQCKLDFLCFNCVARVHLLNRCLCFVL